MDFSFHDDKTKAVQSSYLQRKIGEFFDLVLIYKRRGQDCIVPVKNDGLGFLFVLATV